VKLACEVGSLKDANDAMTRLLLTLPEFFRVMHFSVWVPGEGIGMPTDTSSVGAAVSDEQLIAELRRIALQGDDDEPPPRRRRH
jgi:hypothetical protein